MHKSYVIFIIFIIIFFSFFSNKYFSGNNHSKKQHYLPKEYIKKLHINNYDGQGLLHSFISADYWEFNSNDRISTLDNPKCVLYNYPQYSYLIKADFAKIIHNKLNDHIDLIQLNSQVKIIQKYLQLFNNKPPNFTLITKYLDFNPTTEIATTDKEVTIYKPGLVVTAIGMNANLKLNKLILQKQITSTYRKPT